MSADARHHCITCSDEGVVMRVEAVDPETGLARCLDEHGTAHDVEAALVSVEPGDRVLVHAATALARLEAR